jgi:hypothetical protein
MTPEEWDFFSVQIKQIRKRQRIALIMIGVGVLGVAWQIMDAVFMNRKLISATAMSQQNLTRNAELKARLDLSDQTYIKYINEVVNRMWDKLSDDNPDIVVPQAPTPRPPGLPEITKDDLARPTAQKRTPAPTPTPRVIQKTRTKVKYKVRKQSFWETLFKPSSHR